MKIYAILDKIQNSYAQPFYSQNDAVALRNFKLEVNRAAENNLLYHNAKDFTLSRLGEIDQDTGIITPEPNGPAAIATGDSLIIKG